MPEPRTFLHAISAVVKEVGGPDVSSTHFLLPNLQWPSNSVCQACSLVFAHDSHVVVTFTLLMMLPKGAQRLPVCYAWQMLVGMAAGTAAVDGKGQCSHEA